MVPKHNACRTSFIAELHNSAYASHLGARKTLAALQQRVWWPSMQRDVRKYVAGCSVCQRIKDVNQAPAGLL